MALTSGEHQGPLSTATLADAAPSTGPRRLGLPLVRHGLIAVVALVVIFLLSQTVGAFRNLQLANVAYYACAASGLTVLTGLSGQISLGQGAFMAVGCYVAALLFIHAHLPLVVVLLLATLATAVVGGLVGAAGARLRGPYLAGATLAFAVGLPALADWRHLTGVLGGDNGLTFLSPLPPAWLGPSVTEDQWQLWVCGIALVLTMLVLANLSRSRIGRLWRAVRDDEIAASLAGLSVARLQIGAFIVSAACAGLGGALLAFVNTLAAPGAFPLSLSLQLLTAVVLGGLGSLAGAIYGSFVLVFLPTWASDLASSMHLSRDIYANLPLAVYGVVLILVMLLFPRGLQGGVQVLWTWLWRRVSRLRSPQVSTSHKSSP